MDFSLLADLDKRCPFYVTKVPITIFRNNLLAQRGAGNILCTLFVLLKGSWE